MSLIYCQSLVSTVSTVLLIFVIFVISCFLVAVCRLKMLKSILASVQICTTVYVEILTVFFIWWFWRFWVQTIKLKFANYFTNAHAMRDLNIYRKASASSPKGNAHTFTYLHNIYILHNTDF